MNKKYLLSPLIHENEIQSDTCWEKYENPYDFLIKEMELQNDSNKSIFEGGSNAVPHVFEQMMLFHKAFLDKEHPEHNRAVIEWKSILVLLALQRVQNIEISLKKIEFNETSQNAFLRAATMFLPEDIPVFYQTTWDFIYIVCLKNEPVALISPITLVCPGKEFMKKITKGLEHRIIKLEKVDKVECLFLDVENEGLIYHSIYSWLEILKGKLECSMPENSEVNERANKVINQVELFMEECEKKAVKGVDIPFFDDIYPVMNNTIREEYKFLNFCCDFIIKNEKMKFLVKRYKEDIFEKNIAILLYDKTPDSLNREENIEKLEKIFSNVLTLNGKSVIFVEKPSGERVAACVLVPFKEKFVYELMEKQIGAEEFFEKFRAVYDYEHKEIVVSLQICGFPYAFEKVYRENDQKAMYVHELPNVFLWPGVQMKSPQWDVYYTYVENNDAIEVLVPMSENSIQYVNMTDSNKKRLFQLIWSRYYVSYLKLQNMKVSGYLPLNTLYKGKENVGKRLDVYIDIGHSTTCVKMVKRNSDKEYEIIPLNIPQSLRIVDGGQENNVDCNFLSAENSTQKGENLKYIKNMLHCFREYKTQEEKETDLSPFSAGQIIFDAQAYCKKNNTHISFFNFEYYISDQEERERVHTFIEEILLYIAYQAQNIQCSYLKLNFLHDMKKNDVSYGEILGLWEKKLDWVKHWTGIKSVYNMGIDSLEEYQALTYNTYYNASKQDGISVDNMYVGIDIGWKKTLVTYFSGFDLGKTDSLEVLHSRMEYGGRDISLMREDVWAAKGLLSNYIEVLSILLNGSAEYKSSRRFKNILEKFEHYCSGQDTQHNAYYQGLFDLLAMMIEEEMPSVSADIYNNMQEFRKYVGILTYNLFLLFLNLGCILGKNDKVSDKLYVYVGGNGSKFFRWITNLKDISLINKDNCDNVFILKMGESILNIIKKGYKIVGNESGQPKEISIIFLEDAKEQLVNGYMFKENCEYEKKKLNQKCDDFDGAIDKKKEDSKQQMPKTDNYHPQFLYQKVDNVFMNVHERSMFEDVSEQLASDMFEEGDETIVNDSDTNEKNKEEEKQNCSLNIDEIVLDESKRVCGEIIKNVQEMRSRRKE